MPRIAVVPLGSMFALAAAPAARAQVTLDVSKITCDQYTSHKITSPQNIAIWLSGYYHGKRGDPRSRPKHSLRMRKRCETIVFVIVKLWSCRPYCLDQRDSIYSSINYTKLERLLSVDVGAASLPIARSRSYR
jgi:HdeA/HdeB family protein